MVIAMFGSAIPICEEWYNETYYLGASLSRRGHELLYGGSKTGEMGAISDGWREGNGHVCGVIPKPYVIDWADEKNELCNNFIFTDTLSSRKEILHANSNIQIIFPGSYGTFDELCSALCRQKLKIDDSKVIIFNQHGFYDDLLKFFDSAGKALSVRGYKDYFKVCNTVDEILDYIDYIEETKKDSR